MFGSMHGCMDAWMYAVCCLDAVSCLVLLPQVMQCSTACSACSVCNVMHIKYAMNAMCLCVCVCAAYVRYVMQVVCSMPFDASSTCSTCKCMVWHGLARPAPGMVGRFSCDMGRRCNAAWRFFVRARWSDFFQTQCVALCERSDNPSPAEIACEVYRI